MDDQNEVGKNYDFDEDDEDVEKLEKHLVENYTNVKSHVAKVHIS